MDPEFRITRRVQFAETDMAGVMHFSNYFRWMEEVEHAFWRSHGESVVTAKDDHHVSWPRVSVGCDYHAPAHFEDELELRFRVVRLGERSVTFEVEFLRDNVRIARGRTTAACCRMEKGEFAAVAIPAELRAVLTGALASSDAVPAGP